MIGEREDATPEDKVWVFFKKKKIDTLLYDSLISFFSSFDLSS